MILMELGSITCYKSTRMREVIIGQLFTAPNNNSIMYPTQPKDPEIQVTLYFPKYILCNPQKFKDRPVNMQNLQKIRGSTTTNQTVWKVTLPKKVDEPKLSMDLDFLMGDQNWSRCLVVIQMFHWEMVLFWSHRKDAANSLSFGSHSIGWSLKTGNMWEKNKDSWDNQITWPLDLACFQHDLDSKSSTLHLLILMCLHPLLLLSCHRVRTLRFIQNHKIRYKSNKPWDQLTQSQATHLIFDSKIPRFSSIPIRLSFRSRIALNWSHATGIGLAEVPPTSRFWNIGGRPSRSKLTSDFGSKVSE